MPHIFPRNVEKELHLRSRRCCIQIEDNLSTCLLSIESNKAEEGNQGGEKWIIYDRCWRNPIPHKKTNLASCFHFCWVNFIIRSQFCVHEAEIFEWEMIYVFGVAIKCLKPFVLIYENRGECWNWDMLTLVLHVSLCRGCWDGG